MNWELIQDLFNGQGRIFWAAVAAVALGLTMLSVSIVFQVRKVAGGRRPSFAPRWRKKAAPTVPRVTLTADGYQASGVMPAPPAARQTAAEPRRTNDPLLVSLHDRLRAAADRLESVHGSLGEPGRSATNNPHSGLKDPAIGVDYIHKSARA